MPSDTPAEQQPAHADEDLDVLAADDAAEEIPDDDDNDMAMDSGDDDDAAAEELTLANDAIAYFDEPQDSLFAIAQHPLHPSLVAVGGSAGAADDAPGAGWVFDTSAAPVALTPLGEAQEVEEVNWLAACPSPDHPNTVALGANDGSVWVYAVDPADAANPLQIVQSYFLHTASCTAGTWTPDGRLLATVSEDGTLHVWDVWGAAAARGLGDSNGQTAVSMTPADQRFEVEGGLYSVAVDPKATFVAVGGAGGAIKIVSLPRLGTTTSQGKKAGADLTAGGQILASLHTQSDGVETLAVTLAQTTPATVLLAAGSVDGSICVYDATRRFAVRRHIVGAHEEHSVVKVEFVRDSWALTSCGMDGVVRRWDLRGGAAAGGPGAVQASGAADGGLVKEWRGHRGDGEGGGVLGFVQGQTGERVVTAGDDGVALVFEA
ncbi:WD40 repeat-like-containing domain protein [Cordyceps fumosorosea ARSEF 2679]|uniref:WD40 repeat-like-containing domain protein n=1 Tax=Cordyceps fumosorosea (strain ARSEF 2679) TaxID=1081104 RepID=A0A167TJA0_CORFA|nr:WD40 repeat-like-containing domain protein [Cordyceps fumosorosea ARSEF 2679]OAA60654.1 WD40 repeat-like-containing domain protein [Cordyceps fumosorosea ARSEF 2679]